MSGPTTEAGRALLDAFDRLDTSDQQRGDETRLIIRSVRTAHAYETVPAIEQEARRAAFEEAIAAVEALQTAPDSADEGEWVMQEDVIDALTRLRDGASPDRA